MNVNQQVLQKKEKYKILKKKFKQIQVKFKDQMNVKNQFEQSLKQTQQENNALKKQLQEQEEQIRNLQSQQQVFDKNIEINGTNHQSNQEQEIKLQKQEKIISLQQSQIQSFLNEIRSQSEVSLKLKETIENFHQKISDLQKQLDQQKEINEKISILKDLYYNQKNDLEIKLSEIQNQLAQKEDQMMNPDQGVYWYKAYLQEKKGHIQVGVILRKRIKGNPIIEIENEQENVISINFDKIIGFQKNNNHEIKITQRALIHSSIVLTFENRNQFYDDFKKFWKIYKNSEIDQNENQNFLSNLKNFLFNQ